MEDDDLIVALYHFDSSKITPQGIKPQSLSFNARILELVLLNDIYNDSKQNRWNDRRGLRLALSVNWRRLLACHSMHSLSD
ncbi:hypothetical protein J6590_099337 [Homalodisca vitripennis]|nr:hypothetical protein J6590_099337 [Homalodisca vitripennis]